MPLGLTLLPLTRVSGVAETRDVNPQAAEINTTRGRPTEPVPGAPIAAGQGLPSAKGAKGADRGFQGMGLS